MKSKNNLNKLFQIICFFLKGESMEEIKTNIALYADEEIYQSIFELLTENEIHFFDRNNSDVRHISSNKYMNYSINFISGYQHLTHVMIQKSFYRNKDIIRLLRKFKLINPMVKILLIMDDDPQYYSLLLSIIAEEKLCSIAFEIDDIIAWFNEEEEFNHDNLIIKKPSKKLWKEFNAA